MSRDWVQGFTRRYHPTHFTSVDISLIDIAQALSHICRYNGHIPIFLSVAEHSVLVAQRVRELGGDDTAYRQALLHDASEAYLGDICRPVKSQTMMKKFCEYDDQIQQTIYREYGLPEEMLPIVNRADNDILFSEASSFWGPLVDQWEWNGRQEMVPLGNIGKSPYEARTQFTEQLQIWFLGGESSALSP